MSPDVIEPVVESPTGDEASADACVVFRVVRMSGRVPERYDRRRRAVARALQAQPAYRPRPTQNPPTITKMTANPHICPIVPMAAWEGVRRE